MKNFILGLLLCVVALSGNVEAVYCHNDPINNVDVLGLKSVGQHKQDIKAAAKIAKIAVQSHGNTAAILNNLSAADFNANPRIFSADGRVLAVLGDQSTGRLISSLRLANDNALRRELRFANAKAITASAGINRLYRHAAFQDDISGNDIGTINPANIPEYFDDENPEFLADERSAFWININPSREIAKHTVLGNYGRASYEFGKEVAIWSTFGVLGEAAMTGRVALRAGTMPRFAMPNIRAGGRLNPINYGVPAELYSGIPRLVYRGPNKLATGTNEAVFWSGIGRGGDKVAAQWVAKNGGATLETTLASRGIALPAWNPNSSSVIAAWEKASVDFARGARGHIRVLQGDPLRTNAIFGAEFRALKANPNVLSIKSINPQTGAEVLLWLR